jgi:hypothetical protein
MTTKSQLRPRIRSLETALAEAIERSDALQQHIDVLLRVLLRPRYQMVQRVAPSDPTSNSEANHGHAPSVQNRGR